MVRTFYSSSKSGLFYFVGSKDGCESGPTLTIQSSIVGDVRVDGNVVGLEPPVTVCDLEPGHHLVVVQTLQPLVPQW